jgi:hypothetical protein
MPAYSLPPAELIRLLPTASTFRWFPTFRSYDEASDDKIYDFGEHRQGIPPFHFFRSRPSRRWGASKCNAIAETADQTSARVSAVPTIVWPRLLAQSRQRRPIRLSPKVRQPMANKKCASFPMGIITTLQG